MVCIVSSGEEDRSEGTWTLLSPLGVAGAWALYWLLALDEVLECDCDGGSDGDGSPFLPLFGGIVHCLRTRQIQLRFAVLCFADLFSFLILDDRKTRSAATIALGNDTETREKTAFHNHLIADGSTCGHVTGRRRTRHKSLRPCTCPTLGADIDARNKCDGGEGGDGGEERQ